MWAPFDAVAGAYDDSFTNEPVARWLRDRVWRHVDRAFAPGMRVLDLGCGTGEDALHLARSGVAVLAVDESLGMLVVAAAKRAGAPGGRVPSSAGGHEVAGIDFAAMRLPHLAIGAARAVTSTGAAGLAHDAADLAPFDGALADFGVLNCIPDLHQLAAHLAGLIRPGGMLVAVVMAPLCLWEIAWYLSRADVGRAVRRLGPKPATARMGRRSLAIWYPSPWRTDQAFKPWFRRTSLVPLAIAMPPSYAFGALNQRPRLAALLYRLEAVLSRWPLLAPLADHYMITLERCPSPNAISP